MISSVSTIFPNSSLVPARYDFHVCHLHDVFSLVFYELNDKTSLNSQQMSDV